MAGQSKVTTDHDAIRKWIEDRGGKPAAVTNTEGRDDPGLLRVDFPGRGRDEGRGTLDEISWDDFFRKFDEKDLAFLYQDEMKSGQESRFFKFVSRQTAEDQAEGARSARRRASSGGKAGEAKAESDTKKTSARSRTDTKKSETKAASDTKKSEARAKAGTDKTEAKAKADTKKTESGAKPRTGTRRAASKTKGQDDQK